VKVSCVLPIHNEAKYLRYSLPTLLKSPFHEIIIVLDRCVDDSKHIVEAYADDRFTIVLKTRASWKNRCAEAKHVGCSNADGDLIFFSDADIILDLKAVEKALRLFKRHTQLEVVVFSYKQYTLDGSIFQRIRDKWVNLATGISRKTNIQPKHTGIYLIKKSLAKITDHPSEYDVVQQKTKLIHIETNTLHLRPGYSKQKQIGRGKARMVLPQYNFLKILLSTIIGLQPYMLTSYLMETSK